MNENPFASPQYDVVERPQSTSAMSYDVTRVVPLDSRCSWVTIAFGIKILAATVQIVASLILIKLLSDVQSGIQPSAEFGSMVQLASMIVVFLAALTFLFCIITFLTWMHRAAKNLEPLGTLEQQYTPGWCIGCWFVPVAHLFWPYQAMKEIWLGSEPDFKLSPHLRDESLPSSLKLWWGFWLGFLIISRLAQFGSDEKEAAGSALIALISVEAIAVASSIVAAVFAIKLVHEITRRQRLRLENLELLSNGSGSKPLPTALPPTETPDFLS